jgi:ERCC4-related helicase
VSKGLCPANKVVCLVVDECHRAIGNAPIVNALRGIHTTRGAALRVIGLSATPGSQPEKIQEVIKNLRITQVRFYSNQHEEVKLFRHKITEDVHVVKVSDVYLNALIYLSNEPLSALFAPSPTDRRSFIL